MGTKSYLSSDILECQHLTVFYFMLDEQKGKDIHPVCFRFVGKSVIGADREGDDDGSSVTV